MSPGGFDFIFENMSTHTSVENKICPEECEKQFSLTSMKANDEGHILIGDKLSSLNVFLHLIFNTICLLDISGRTLLKYKCSLVIDKQKMVCCM